jgi:hypothetical protein
MLSPDTIAIYASIFATVTMPVLGAVATLTWWLSSQFRRVEENARRAMAAHEKVDQGRHEENLERFSEIGKDLTRLQTSANGAGRHHYRP